MSQRPRRTTECNGDLQWLALRYVLEELDERGRLSFEARLAHDPAACTAVAEAVELIGACLAIREESPEILGVRPRRKLTGVGLLALATAAGILLASSLVEFSPPSESRETIALELAWSGLQRETIHDPEPDHWPVNPLADSSFPATTDDLIDNDDEARGEPVLPGWLIAAVELDDEFPDHEVKPLEN